MACLDLESDPLLTFAEAARLVRPEKPIHVASFFRWAQHGCRGVKLATTKLGGRTYVRRSQLESFIAALSGSPEPASPAPFRATTPGQSQRIERARAELKAAGIA